MEEEALKLLRLIMDLKEISLYELAETWSRKKRANIQEVFDEVLRLVYLLDSHNLIELKTIEGADGFETSVKPTTFGETYLKSEVVKKIAK